MPLKIVAGGPGASLYLLTDHSGRILAGNVTQISTELLARAIQEPTSVGYRTQQGEERLAMVSGGAADRRLLLLVGRDMAERERFADIIRLALIVTAALLVGLGILSWFLCQPAGAQTDRFGGGDDATNHGWRSNRAGLKSPAQ